MSEMLGHLIRIRIKKGLKRDYHKETEDSHNPKGRISLSETIKLRSRRDTRVACEFDEFLANIPVNQVLKTTLEYLIRHRDDRLGRLQQDSQPVGLKRLMPYFSEVNTLPIASINWSGLSAGIDRDYRTMMLLCEFILHRKIFDNSDGRFNLVSDADKDSLSRLFEEFVRSYYVYHFPRMKNHPRKIIWDTESTWLPGMHTDVTIRDGSDMLIIDTKYYSSILNRNPMSSRMTYNSDNLYQIVSYVQNAAKSYGYTVSGVLLYALTRDTSPQEIEKEACISGYRISIMVLDLNREFAYIRDKLDRIIIEHFTQF